VCPFTKHGRSWRVTPDAEVTKNNRGSFGFAALACGSAQDDKQWGLGAILSHFQGEVGFLVQAEKNARVALSHL